MLEVHPFLKSFEQAGFFNSLPPQMITMKEKMKGADSRGVSTWYKRCLDTFETIARQQYHKNKDLLVNEKLLNAEFIYSDYYDFDESEFAKGDFDPLNEVVKELGIPKYIKHYDIIRAVIMTQVQEFEQLPDSFHIVAEGEDAENDRTLMQKDLLMKWVEEEINFKVQELIKDIPKDENYEQNVQQIRQQKTPVEIAGYFKYQYKHFAEEWASYELEDQVLRYRLKTLRRNEFLNFLSTGRRFRYIYPEVDHLKIEKINWANVFYQKSNNIDYVQHGDYVGQIYVGSVHDILNRYGMYMTKEEKESFEFYTQVGWREDKSTKDIFGNKVDYTSVEGLPYNQFLPSLSPDLNRVAPFLGMNWLTKNSMDIDGLYSNPHGRQFVVVEAYWRSYALVGRLCWMNPETELVEVVKVDENFIKPSWIKELKNSTFSDEPELNTIVWSWEEQLMEGIKINRYSTSDSGRGLYLKCKPMDYQGVNKYKAYGKPLPIAGQVSNSRNLTSTNQIELLKPYQFWFNIIMNSALKLMQKTLGAFVAVDLNTLINEKGWGGEDSIHKFLGAVEENGVAPFNTSPAYTGGANSGGQLPRVLDIDNTPKVVQYLNIANGIKSLAYSQLGFSPARLGDMEGIDTATGINASVAKSHNATSSWFSEYFECEAELIKQQLDAAQWLQSNKKDFKALLSKGIMSESFLINNKDFDLYDLRVYVSDNQEELRQLNMYKQLAMSNNTIMTDMSTRMEMVSSSNANKIKNLVKSEEEKARQREQQIQQYNQQLQQAATETERLKIEEQRAQFYAKLENEKEVAWIKSRGYVSEGEQDIDKSNIPDAFEYEKFTSKASSDADKLNLHVDKLNLEREKEYQRRLEKQQELDLQKQKIELDRFKTTQTAKNVKILDKGKYNG